MSNSPLTSLSADLGLKLPMLVNPLEALRKNPFVLAPMAGITDHAFRTFMRRRGASIVVTELVSATGLEYKSDRTRSLMSFDEEQRPIGIQLFGEDPEIIARGAKVAQSDGCDFVDLNFGCPVPKVVKKGGGSAMLKDPVLMQKVLSTVKKAIDIPLTIKIRTGWDDSNRNALEICNIAYNEGVSWVAIHGRTRNQGYSGLADWDFIADIKAKTKIPIIGNGDIHTPQQAVLRMQQFGVDGVMIGRGCLKNPMIFAQAMQLWSGNSIPAPKNEFGKIFAELMEAISLRCDDHIAGIQMRKFAAWFSAGYAGSAQFRKSIFQCKENSEALQMCLEFFASIDGIVQEDTSAEDFLMGGHG